MLIKVRGERKLVQGVRERKRRLKIRAWTKTRESKRKS